MEMISVQSSQIAQIGHDGGSTLRILFRRGGLYEYAGVTSAEFDELRSAESIGSHFGRCIKGVKPFTRVAGSDFTTQAATPAPAVHHEPRPRTVVSETVQAAPAPELENQEVEQVAQKASLLVQNAKTIKVVDTTTQHQASQVLLAIASLRKEVADTFRPMKEAAFRAHRTICDQEKKHDQPLADAERAVKAQIGSFVAEQQRLAREAEEAARKAAMEEAERKAREEAERRAIEDAIALEEIGDAEGAQAVLENPAPVAVQYVAPAPVAPAVAQVQGVTTREDWDFRIVDDSLIPREYLLVNEQALRAVAKSTKGRARIPGVEFYPKQVVAASRRG